MTTEEPPAPPLELEPGEEIVAEDLTPYKLELGVRSITITTLSRPAVTIRRRWGRTIYPDGWRLLSTTTERET